MKIGLFGYGKMGKLIEKMALEKNHSIAIQTSSLSISENFLSSCDVFIDFSIPSAVLNNVGIACQFQKPIIIGTTGWDDLIPKVQNLVNKHQIGALYSSNFSIGVYLFSKIVSFSATLMNDFSDYDVAGTEIHHRQKKDVPSGTALHLAKILIDHIERKKNVSSSYDLQNSTLHFSSTRCGSIPGTHSILYDSSEDTISLTHQAHNREGFAKGALECALWMTNKKGWYTFDEFINSFLTKGEK